MQLLFVDTSAWVALANRRDANHRAVRGTLNESAGRLLTTNFVFDETVTLALARLGHDAAMALGRQLRDPDVVHMVHLTAPHQADAWKLFSDRSDKDYSFTDCTSFVVMRKLGLPVAATLDAHFAQEGFAMIPTSS